MLAADSASRASGVPLVVYLMDLWSQAARKDHLGFGSHADKRLSRVLRSAAAVWSISPFMSEYVRAKFGVTSAVLMPAVNVESYRAARSAALDVRGGNDDITVVYAGAIYTAQIDAFVNLLRALERVQHRIAGRRARLVVYGHVTEYYLRRIGAWRDWLEIRTAPLAMMPEVLAGADVLFLPLSFASELRQVTATSLPTKTADYLASGVPILVHAPAWSSVTRYAGDWGFGAIVDRPDGSGLIEALASLVTRHVAERHEERSLAAAMANHDIDVARARFAQELRRAAGACVAS